MDYEKEYNKICDKCIPRIRELEKENKKLEKENFVMKDRLKFWYKWVTREEIEKAEEENRQLKLHIEAKDKAYTALLKDYEELKEDNKRLKAEIEEWLNAIRQKI